MIFLKVPVGMRKTATLTMEKTVRGGTINVMSDREPTRWQYNRIYPHPINPCVYTYDSRLYCCKSTKTIGAHCCNIIKS